MNNASLVVVDAQKGFSELCPGELPVPGALEIVGPINRLLALPFGRVDATQEWHQPGHDFFEDDTGTRNPPHCIAGTPGADFLPGLDTHRFHAVWRKGFRDHRETYSLIKAHAGFPTFLHEEGVERVFVCGLATNICVGRTAFDLENSVWFSEVYIVEDASRPIDLPNHLPVSDKLKNQSQGIRYVTVADVEEMFRRGL